MPRPMVPAPMTAMVRISVTLAPSWFKLGHHFIDAGASAAKIVSQALAFFLGHAGDRRDNPAQCGRDVIHVVHGTYEFSAGYHKWTLLGSLVPTAAYHRSSHRIRIRTAD